MWSEGLPINDSNAFNGFNSSYFVVTIFKHNIDLLADILWNNDLAGSGVVGHFL